jgi:hypothetical protein
VIASAAIPNQFRAVHTDGGVHRDGLFSQNPRCATWTCRCTGAGFIETIDRLLAEGRLRSGDRYKQVTVRMIGMRGDALSRELGPASKLNRGPRLPAPADDRWPSQADRFPATPVAERAWAAGDVDAMLVTEDRLAGRPLGAGSKRSSNAVCPPSSPSIWAMNEAIGGRGSGNSRNGISPKTLRHGGRRHVLDEMKAWQARPSGWNRVGRRTGISHSAPRAAR